MDVSPASDGITELKDAIRAAMRAQFSASDGDDRAARSTSICQRLISSRVFEDAMTVMLYMPMRSEVDVIGVALEAFRRGKTVCLPRVEPGRDTMSVVATRSFDNDEMHPDAAGVRSPRGGARVPEAAIDLVVVPGVAFDLNGGRLGRGGGFYDRFLSSLPTTTATIGICFDWQIVDVVPADSRDTPVHAVVTDRRVAHRTPTDRLLEPKDSP